MLALVALASLILEAQIPVGSERLLNAAKEPQNWMIYCGDYSSNRYSTLTQITPANVKESPSVNPLFGLLPSSRYA